jgi:uncharacterized membrane protein YjgN (DUF898 family)
VDASGHQTESAHGEPVRFGQTINPRDYIGLSAKIGLLNIVTLTLYRFWGRTEVRRRIWASTTLNGEPFEYTGLGMELFKGFLLALLVVGLPFLVVIFAVQFLGPLVALPVVMASYLVLFWLYGAGIFLAFRYLTSRTAWRGVRFHLRGAPTPFAWRYLGHQLLTGVTLGWWTPAATLRINRRLWGGLSFGDKPFTWRRADSNLYGPYAIGWFAILIGYIVWAASLVGLVMSRFEDVGAPGAEEMPAEFLLLVYLLAVPFAIYVAAVFAPYQAAVLRTVARSITLDGVRFRLNVGALDLLGLTLVNVALFVVTLGFAAPYVQARTARFLVSRLSAEGAMDLTDARQAGRGPTQGEGLADAFGLSPI